MKRIMLNSDLREMNQISSRSCLICRGVRGQRMVVVRAGWLTDWSAVKWAGQHERRLVGVCAVKWAGQSW